MLLKFNKSKSIDATVYNVYVYLSVSIYCIYSYIIFFIFIFTFYSILSFLQLCNIIIKLNQNSFLNYLNQLIQSIKEENNSDFEQSWVQNKTEIK